MGTRRPTTAWWRLGGGALVLALLASTAIVPDASTPRAAAQVGCVEDPDIGFCVVPQSYRIYFGDEDPLIDDYEWSTQSFTDLGTTTITLADGSTTTVNHYRFKRLTVEQHIRIEEQRAEGGVEITAPGPIELGGTNAAGETMWTDVWGTDLEFQWGTCAITWTYVPDNIGLDISGCWLRMSAYAITSYNPNPEPGERDNPVYLPDATLRVTGGT